MKPTSRNDCMFADISRLWGDVTYVDFQTSLHTPSWLGAAALRAFAAGINTVPTRVLCIMVAIILHPHLRVLDPHADTLFYGPSKNNDRVLQRIAAISNGHCGKQSFAVQKANLATRLRAALQWKKITAISRDLSPYRDAGTMLALQLILTATARVYFETSLVACRARVVILANDHSPMQVGLRGAAYQHGLRCVYCQHAPVSTLYPPLKFDLSVLSNKASLTAYSAIGPVQGDVAFLPLSGNKTRLISGVGNMATVGMCLARVWTPCSVASRLNELCAQANITKIILRPHPEHLASFDDLMALDPRITLSKNDDIAAFAQDCNLVIVPGSGALIDLLHNGVACIYAGDLDQLGHDPHGFVAAGLVPDWTGRSLQELSQNVDAYFGANWQQAFADYDPAIGTDPAILNDKVRAALQKIMI